MISSDTLVRDILNFVKQTLLDNVIDPINRSPKSKFVMTSYPKRAVEYPLITLKLINQSAKRAGMQTVAMDVEIIIEARVWALNEVDKDGLANDVYKTLRNLQFTAITGSEANDLHDFNLLSAVEIDEPGLDQPKSRVMRIKYSFYNI